MASHVLVKFRPERGVKVKISVVKVIHRVMWEGDYDSQKTSGGKREVGSSRAVDRIVEGKCQYVRTVRLFM